MHGHSETRVLWRKAQKEVAIRGLCGRTLALENALQMIYCNVLRLGAGLASLAYRKRGFCAVKPTKVDLEQWGVDPLGDQYGLHVKAPDAQVHSAWQVLMMGAGGTIA